MNVGVLGGGQLGRMLALAGHRLDMRCTFLDSNPDACAGDVGPLIAAPFNDRDALSRFCEGLDVATFEFENVPAEALRYVAEHVALRPSARSLEVSCDRLHEKRFFTECGLGVGAFAPVSDAGELRDAVQRIGLPAVLKTRRMGYDGKGQVVLRTGADVDALAEGMAPGAYLLESFIDFEREVSIVGVRSTAGDVAFYPLVENEHRGGILHRTLAPAPDVDADLQRTAGRYAAEIMTRLDHVGVLTIEFFQTRDGALLGNEMAPRVHNSGHWTIEGARTSQFENHLRAIAGLPLGETRPLGPAVMVNLIGAVPRVRDLCAVPGAAVHLYGKSPASGRKVGHVTAVCADDAERQRVLEEIERLLKRGRTA